MFALAIRNSDLFIRKVGSEVEACSEDEATTWETREELEADMEELNHVMIETEVVEV